MSTEKAEQPRLQKVLARAGVASRRESEALIKAGRVTVNGEVAVLGKRVDPVEDAIKVDGRRIVPPTEPTRYLLLNKPKGFISSTKDPEGRPVVLDLLPAALRKGVVTVGRLDFQTEGLLLLTDDGELAQRVAHPRYGCTKTYLVKVKGRPEESALDRLRRGIVLDGKRTAPCTITALKASKRRREGGNTWWEVVLGEGRSRQIREMFFRIGHSVQKLRRVAVGAIRDEQLPLGGWRELRAGELDKLRRTVGLEGAKKSRGRPRGSTGSKTGKGKKPAGRRR